MVNRGITICPASAAVSVKDAVLMAKGALYPRNAVPTRLRAPYHPSYPRASRPRQVRFLRNPHPDPSPPKGLSPPPTQKQVRLLPSWRIFSILHSKFAKPNSSERIGTRESSGRQIEGAAIVLNRRVEILSLLLINVSGLYLEAFSVFIEQGRTNWK